MLLDEYLLLGLSAYEGGLLLYGSAVEIPVEPTEQSQIGGGRSRSRSKRSYIDEREIAVLFINKPSVFHINVLITDPVTLSSVSTSNFKIATYSKQILPTSSTPYTAKLQALPKSFTLKSKSQVSSFTAKITSIEIDLSEEEEIALLLSL